MPKKGELIKLINVHLHLYQNLEIQDIYKLLYQGVFGAEHLLTNTETAKNRLFEEWDRQQADSSEELVVPVSIAGRVVRLNLRRCKAKGINVFKVWRAFSLSSSHMAASLDEFKVLWRQFYELCELGLAPFNAEHVRTYGEKAKADGFPARHHSTAYRNSNVPAYRVVLRSEIEILLD